MVKNFDLTIFLIPQHGPILVWLFFQRNIFGRFPLQCISFMKLISISMQKLHSIICTQNSRSVINTFSYRITLPITTYISSIHSKLFCLALEKITFQLQISFRRKKNQVYMYIYKLIFHKVLSGFASTQPYTQFLIWYVVFQNTSLL